MRDKIQNEKYFQEYIKEENENINYFQSRLDKNEIREDRILPVKREVYTLRFKILLAKYSIGEDLNEIRRDFLKIIDDTSKFWNAETGYINMIWILSIAIMLDIEGRYWNKLIHIIEASNLEDWLMAYLIARGKNMEEFEGLNFRMQKPYKKLKEIICENSFRKEKLRNYLCEEWYGSHDDMSWYDSHKRKEKVYYGYWSFETGAIVKLLGLDDSDLKNSPYYPYDLVHYKN